MADPLLLAPAALFTVSTAWATAVAATEPDLPGEPFGLRLPGSVRTHLTLGLGSAVSAPWPMPVIATWAALRGVPGSDSAACTVAAVGVGMLAGILAEPVTWGRRPIPATVRGSIPLHLALGVALVSAGTHRLRQHERD